MTLDDACTRWTPCAGCGPGQNCALGIRGCTRRVAPRHPSWLLNLAHNLAIGAALCGERSETDVLRAKLNTPHIADFIEAVQVEVVHQRMRWGVEHDAGKRPEDWIALVVYLLGKATKAHFDGDRDKLFHHVIALAAVAANWHANATGADTTMRPGVAP